MLFTRILSAISPSTWTTKHKTGWCHSWTKLILFSSDHNTGLQTVDSLILWCESETSFCGLLSGEASKHQLWMLCRTIGTQNPTNKLNCSILKLWPSRHFFLSAPFSFPPISIQISPPTKCLLPDTFSAVLDSNFFCITPFIVLNDILTAYVFWYPLLDLCMSTTICPLFLYKIFFFFSMVQPTCVQPHIDTPGKQI